MEGEASDGRTANSTLDRKKQSAPEPPAGWDRCHAYNAKKRRFCRQQPLKLQATSNSRGDRNSSSSSSVLPLRLLYCGNHQHLALQRNFHPLPEASGARADHATSSASPLASVPATESTIVSVVPSLLRKRVPCPIDPSHTVYEDKVKKHVKHCPYLKKQQSQETQDFYVHSMNLGGHGHPGAAVCVEIPSSNLDSSQAGVADRQQSLRWAQQVAIRAIRVHQRIFSRTSGRSNVSADDTDSKLAEQDPRLVSHADILRAIPMEDRSTDLVTCTQSDASSSEDRPTATLVQALEHDMKCYRIKSGGSRHLPQLASLTGHFLQVRHAITGDNGQVVARTGCSEPQRRTPHLSEAPQSKRLLLLEMGAGRGIFGLTAAGISAAECIGASKAKSYAAANAGDGNEHSYIPSAPSHSTGTTQRLPANSVRLTMIERTGSRSKAETVLRNVHSRLAKTGRSEHGSSDTLGASLNNTSAIDGRSQTASVRQGSSQPKLLCLQNVGWTRISCDIAHVDLQKVLDKHAWPSNERRGNHKNTSTGSGSNTDIDIGLDADSSSVVVIAKHLCGAGTDLALKAMAPIAARVDGCVMATCCHGVCNWSDYVGRDYLQEAMCNGGVDTLASFGAAEFDLLRKWSAGTVVAFDTDLKTSGGSARFSTGSKDDARAGDEDDEHPIIIDSATNDDSDDVRFGVSNIVSTLGLRCGVQGLGRACQRLIDHGRHRYLQEIVFSGGSKSGTPNLESTCKRVSRQDGSALGCRNVKLCHYVPATVTPQNAVLVGWQR